MRVALVVGGSGMLTKFCQQLAAEYDMIGVIGRTKDKMRTLNKLENIIPIYVDYTDTAALTENLEAFVAHFGTPELTVSWIHATAPDATTTVASYCTGDFYEVTGHVNSDNHQLSKDHEAALKDQDVSYHRIVLGASNGAWLTNEQISDGVQKAVQNGQTEQLIGEA